MTLLTKNPRTPSRKFFFECRLEYLPRLLRLLPGLSSIPDQRNSHAKPHAFWCFFLGNPQKRPDAKVLTDSLWQETLNPLTTTRATIVAQGFFVITRQPLQLDRCSNPLRMRTVFLVLLKRKYFDWGEAFAWGGLTKLGCFRFFDQL